MEEHQHAPQLPKQGEHTKDGFEEAISQLEGYFSGTLQKFDLPLSLEGTGFQKQVWAGLLKIPYGETISYGELARSVGRPSASRAVGLANGRNPLAIIVPCHRVIGANGSLVGYGGGLDRKVWLLQHEASHRWD
jgi:methylated-DNA-[protein]-cysteine S-methyltransferase